MKSNIAFMKTRTHLQTCNNRDFVIKYEILKKVIDLKDEYGSISEALIMRKFKMSYEAASYYFAISKKIIDRNQNICLK